MDRMYYFNDLYGGSQASGYIQFLLGAQPDKFDIKRVSRPSPGLLSKNTSTKKRMFENQSVAEQVKTIKEVLFSGRYSVEEQKEAIRKTLDILNYKENHIIQEARKPLQRDLVSMLAEIKVKPEWKKYDVFGQAPASGKPVYTTINLKKASELIPPISKSLIDEVKAEIKKEKLQRKKQERDRSFQVEIEAKEREAKDNAIVESYKGLREYWGKYPDKLFNILKSYNVRDAIDFSREKNKILKAYPNFPERPDLLYKAFWIDFEDM